MNCYVVTFASSHMKGYAITTAAELDEEYLRAHDWVYTSEYGWINFRNVETIVKITPTDMEEC